MSIVDRAYGAVPDASAAQARQLGRDRLARMVVFGSFLTLFLLVAALVGLTFSESPAMSEAAKNAFTAILPVLAGWVGTVLAFYFSAASQDASLDKVLNQSVAGRVGSGALVSEKMIPFSSIKALQELNQDNRPQTITVEKLSEAFNTELTTGVKATRLIFVEAGVFKYMLHIGTFNAFVVKNGGFDAAKVKTLADMLSDEETLRQISKLVVFVSAATTLGDAKLALDKVSGAQDIIVTGSGNSTGPMLGWLSNVDLIKALTVA